jgi:hypothetical protein
MYLLLALLLLGGCRSKKSSRTEHREEQKSERKEVKDSATHLEKSQKVATFDLQHSQSYEITLESDKDSAGNAKELVYYRIRDGDSETIRVQGGKVILKSIESHSKSHQQADSTLTIDNKIIEKKEEKNYEISQKKQEEKQVEGTHWWSITWIIVLSLILFIAWRMKLF